MTYVLGALLVVLAIFSFSDGGADAFVVRKPSGHYGIGTFSFQMTDGSRTSLRSSEPRRWMVQAYYPTDNMSEPRYPYMPGTLTEGKVLGAPVLSYAKPSGEIARDKRFPIIFFIPGFGNNRQNYTILCEELASQGFVVLSLDQPYVSNFSRYTDGSVIGPTLYDLWKSRKDRDYRYKYYDEAMDAAIRDVLFMMDQLPALSSERFVGTLDPGAIVIMGHSFGGNVAHTVGFQEKRIQAVVDIDSKITERKIFGRMGVPPNPSRKPVLFIRGMQQYQEDVGDQLFRIENSRVVGYPVQHSAFTALAYFPNSIQKKIQAQTLLARLWKWFSKNEPIFEVIDMDLGGKTADQWFDLWLHDLVNWLRSNLHEDRYHLR